MTEGDARGLSCLFLFQCCGHRGFSSQEGLVLVLGFCRVTPGMFSPLPTLGAALGLGLGPRGGPVSEVLSEPGRVVGTALRGPYRKNPGRWGSWLSRHTPHATFSSKERDAAKLSPWALPWICCAHRRRWNVPSPFRFPLLTHLQR